MKALLIATVAIAASGCIPPPAGAGAGSDRHQTSRSPGATSEEISLSSAGIDERHLDRKTDPCSDFYQFACGGFHHSVPAGRTIWDRFEEAEAAVDARMRELLDGDDRVASAPDIGDARRFYRACTDEAAIEKSDLQAVAGLLGKIDAVTDRASLVHAVAELHRHSISALFHLTEAIELEKSGIALPEIRPALLGLPAGDYYRSKDRMSRALRSRYLRHIEAMLALSMKDAAPAAGAARQVLAVEKAIAASVKSGHSSPPPVPWEKLGERAPNWDWKLYWKLVRAPATKRVRVDATQLTALNRALEARPIKAWKLYLRWHLLRSLAGDLPARFRKADHEFRAMLGSVGQPKPRWRYCVHATRRALPAVFVPWYRQALANEETRLDAEKLMVAISAQLGIRTNEAGWLTVAARERAQRKLVAVEKLVGGPTEAVSLEFRARDKHLENAMRHRAADARRRLSRLGKPADRTRWSEPPAIANLYYDAAQNRIVVPAVVLTPPFFDPARPLAANAGRLGALFGHELLHAIDAGGAEFDGAGVRKRWWTKTDDAAYAERAACFADSYSSYELSDGSRLDGARVAREAVADAVGLRMAYDAFRAARAAEQTHTVASGFNEEQLFFLSFAQTWCSATAPADLERRLASGNQAPPRWRVLGSIASLPEFADAFSCQRPRSMCEVW